MSTFAVTNSDQLLPAVNYLLSNLDTQTVQGNITIPGNVLVANTSTGVVSQSGNANVSYYLYQYVNLRYSNNAVGTAGFDTASGNYSYFGVFNSTSSTPSVNPASYQWYEVDPPFDTATSRTLYYSAIGGRQIQWAAASSPPSSNYVVTVANVAIDLDVVTTAAGTPGERGPVVMAGVITTADPNLATSATLTGWFEASRSAATAPIGTGLIPPVLGDTASFTYAAGVGQPQAAYEYNGSIWIPVDGQVVSGNVIVRGTIAGNAMIANTITATQIATGTITATQIAANTITANNIATGTITATQIAANTITGNRIAAGTITTNNFTANTIQGNIIAAGTITATQLAANAITANTVISSGAVLNNNASLGFWLDGPTGNARFGNSISIGNQLTVGSGANIGAGLIVGSGANIGTNLIVGANATVGANLIVGSGANIGANLIVGSGANIGASLIVGNNASIGGNLTVSGLITSGGLNANTVSTTTVVPLSISSGTGATTTASQIFSNLAQNTTASSTFTLDFTTTEINQPLFVFAGVQAGLQFTTIPSSVDVTGIFYLRRTNVSTGAIVSLFDQTFDVNNVTTADGSTAFFYPSWTGVADTISTPGTYRYSIAFQYSKTGATSGITTFYFLGRTWLVQTLKR